MNLNEFLTYFVCTVAMPVCVCIRMCIYIAFMLFVFAYSLFACVYICMYVAMYGGAPSTGFKCAVAICDQT